MAYKTFSQKAARFFEIVCYVLLAPAVFSIIFTVVYGAILFFIPFAITCFGVLLLHGYRKHARGTLDEDKLSLLWFGTFIFNAIPLAPVFYQVVLNSKKAGVTNPLFLDPFIIGFSLLTLWWIIAVSLSVTLILDIFKSRT